jgi:hypothetical protein
MKRDYEEKTAIGNIIIKSEYAMQWVWVDLTTLNELNTVVKGKVRVRVPHQNFREVELYETQA